MPKEKMLWSKDGLSSVKSSKLRSFSIMEENRFDGLKYSLYGHFGKNDTFDFGYFDNENKAILFLNRIHDIIEGGK